MRPLAVVVVVAACKSSAPPPPSPCVQLDDQVIGKLAADWAREHRVPVPPLAPLITTVQEACKHATWERPVEEAAALVATVLSTHTTAPGDGGTAESGPHPDYPTPVAAGTANLFFLEDPERGPPVPANVRMPARSSLSWKPHAYCETNRTRYACSSEKTGAGLASFRVGTRGDTSVIEELYGTRVVATTQYTMASGELVQRLELDARGVLVSAYSVRDHQLSGRRRNGGNALAGCGYFRLQGGELTCLQWLGEPMLDMRGVATYKGTRDARGFLSEESSFGLDGAPSVDNTGKHTTRVERDNLSRPLVERYFDLAGKRVADPDGCSGERMDYEPEGGIAHRTCLDDRDQPRGRSNGVAIYEFLYDAQGCRIGTRFLDKASRPTTDPDGVHGNDQQVDRFCSTTRSTCIGLDGGPRACSPDHPSTTQSTFDAAGNETVVTYWHDQGVEATDHEFGAFELRFRYDAVGNQTAMSCFGPRGRAIECMGTGFHEKRAAFDANGRKVKETFFTATGQPAANLGATSRRYKYDNYDHSFEAQAFDANGELTTQLGATTIRELYDARHRRFALVLLDKDGIPARYAACFTGSTCPDQPWHAVRITRLGDGTPEYNQFFDADGQLMEVVNCRTNKCFD